MSWYYAPGNIPLDAPPWLQRELMSISRASYGTAPMVQFEVQHAEPAKPREGMVAFSDGTDWAADGSGAGLFVYYGSAWHRLG